MSDRDFYRILGVGRSSSAREIRSAYRELVKRYHPDLYANAAEKAAATEKLRQINEAYRVLGNQQRRQRYDTQFARPAQTRPRPPAGRKPQKAPSSRRNPGFAQRWGAIFKGHRARRLLSKKTGVYALAAALAAGMLVYANQSETKIAAAWLLMEKVETSSGEGSAAASAQRWTPLGEYGGVSDCAAMLKKIVHADEKEGSRVIYDERVGTMAITVYMKGGSSQSQRDSGADPSGSADGEKSPQQSGGEGVPTPSPSKDSAFKRVRNLECREVQKIESISRAERVLRRFGLLQ